MSLYVDDFDIGLVTAYAYYVEGGGTLTEEEFTEFIADFGEAAQTAVNAAGSAQESAETASTAAGTATTKAGEASTSATGASSSASAASASASQASGSATNAAASATAASGSATAAAGSASTASTKASEASASATAAQTAQTAAEAAQSAAETAQGKAEDARDAAETTAQSISASAAQIATNTADITQLKSELSQKADINGYYEELSAGTADQLNSTQYVEDSVPYLFRTTGGSADVGDRADVRAIVGGTVAWNQLNGKPNNIGSTTKNDVTATWNSDKTWTLNGTATESGGILIYYNGGTIPSGHKVLFGTSDYVHNHVGVYQNGYSADVDAKLNANGGFTVVSGGMNCVIYIFENETYTNEVIRPQMFDLTQMFGSTIADYIYSLEQSTAGAGVAFFRKLFPADYYPYDAGTLKSVEGVSEKVTRDADNNVLGTYPLDSTLTLRGIPKLADGKLYYDGDRYLPDGTVTRRYGIVDLGTLTWMYESNYTRFRADYVGYKRPVNNDTVGVILCAKYQPVGSSYTAEASYDKVIGVNATSDRIVVRDTSYSSDAATFKAAMSGVYFVYELATPTTETADPYQSLQVCDPNGTEEFVTTGIVPVGHETRYPENLRAKIEGLPWDFSSLIAPTEKTTTASRNYTTGALLIMNNVLYKVTANIANGGTITPNTNVTATTLSEVISALQ